MKIYNNKIRNKRKIVKKSFIINLFLQNIYSSIKFSTYKIIIGALLTSFNLIRNRYCFDLKLVAGLLNYLFSTLWNYY